jgi:hypothetical protein
LKLSYLIPIVPISIELDSISPPLEITKMVYSVNRPIGIDVNLDISEQGRMNNLEASVRSLHGRKREGAKVLIGLGTIGCSRKRSECWIYSKSLPYVWRKMVSILDLKLVFGTSVRMWIDKLDLVERHSPLA